MSDRPWTREAIKNFTLKPTLFTDGERGAASQNYVCNQCPEIAQTWCRKSYRDKGEVTWFYNDMEFASVDEMLDALNEMGVPFPSVTGAPEARDGHSM